MDTWDIPGMGYDIGWGEMGWDGICVMCDVIWEGMGWSG